jgi:hypothetical protein
MLTLSLLYWFQQFENLIIFQRKSNKNRKINKFNLNYFGIKERKNKFINYII